jgi:hypothetical protein
VAGELERGPGPGALPDPDSVVIPDDVSALEAEAWAWRAEQLRRDRRGPGAHGPRSTTWRVAGRVVPMLLGSLLLVAFLASLATTVRPATVDSLTPAPLDSPSIPDGQVGGLLPAGIVDVDGATRSTRALRPATLVIVPAAGASQSLLDAVYLQSQAYGIATGLVGPPERQALLERTSDDIGVGLVPVVIDRQSVIATSLGLPPQADTTIVVVGTDGRIQTVVENPSDGIQLQSALSRAAAGLDPPGTSGD